MENYKADGLTPVEAGNPATVRLSFTAGFMCRRNVRFIAATLGLAVQEFKGWLESGFVVTGDAAAIRRFKLILLSL